MALSSLPELRLKSEGELRHLLREARTKLADLRQLAAAGSLRQVRQIRIHRLAIARILTLLASRFAKQEKMR